MALRRQLLITSLFLLTPGKLGFFMGDEYFSDEDFAIRPSPLARSVVGSYANGKWIQRGEKAGLFDCTRELLALRQTNRVGYF